GPVLHAGDTRGGATLCQAGDGASDTAHGFPPLVCREWSTVRLRGSPNFSSPIPALHCAHDDQQLPSDPERTARSISPSGRKMSHLTGNMREAPAQLAGVP